MVRWLRAGFMPAVRLLRHGGQARPRRRSGGGLPASPRKENGRREVKLRFSG
ncbi:hypothetical protein [Alteribacter lacisalsi]|uniref:hypothetical protein n=1 Tax=Alteribacter lacisalsi TaxID=2045244 RepID=UPI001374D38C|nr:hypothetical protein [Alteribacter lacisalsi]